MRYKSKSTVEQHVEFVDSTKVEQQLLLQFNMLTNFALWWLPLYTYVYTYICVNVYILYTCVYMYRYEYIYIFVYIYVYVCASVCMGPRPRRFTLKDSAGCYYLSIIKKAKYVYFALKASNHTTIFCFSITFRPPGRNQTRRRAACQRPAVVFDFEQLVKKRKENRTS